MWKEFKAFLVKQNAVALAIAVVVGVALNAVVKSIVDGLIMPIVEPLQKAAGGSYEQLTLTIGPFAFKPGIVIAALINFLIVGFVAWRISKIFVKPEGPKPATKTCPFCQMADLDARATRCPHCTSQLAGADSAGAAPTLLPGDGAAVVAR